MMFPGECSENPHQSCRIRTGKAGCRNIGPIKFFADSYVHAIALKNGVIVGELKAHLDVDEKTVSHDPFPIVKERGREITPQYAYTKNGHLVVEQTVGVYEKASFELIPREGTTIYLLDGKNVDLNKIDYSSLRKYNGEILDSGFHAIIVKDNAIVGEIIIDIAVAVS